VEVSIVLVAMFFEHVYHQLHRSAKKSWLFGETMIGDESKEAMNYGQIFGDPLKLVILNRAAGEFMCLGFLAFVVWALEERLFFEWLAGVNFNGVSTPNSGHVYLEFVELVHMQMFIGMLIYFAVALVIVELSIKRNSRLEELRLLWIEQLKSHSADDWDSDPEELREFKRS